jgi:hypothetical protein
MQVAKQEKEQNTLPKQSMTRNSNNNTNVDDKSTPKNLLQNNTYRKVAMHKHCRGV